MVVGKIDDVLGIIEFLMEEVEGIKRRLEEIGVYTNTTRIQGGLEKKNLLTCPRCGRPISYLKKRNIKGHIYVYAVHYEGYEKIEGRVVKRVRECYLGPDYIENAIRALEDLIGQLEKIASSDVRRELGRRLVELGQRLMSS